MTNQNDYYYYAKRFNFDTWYKHRQEEKAIKNAKIKELINAIKAEDVPLIKSLLKKNNIDITDEDASGQSPLEVSIEVCNPEIVYLLIERDNNYPDNLFYVLYNDQSKLLDYLFILASVKRPIKNIKQILDLLDDDVLIGSSMFNEKNSDGETPLDRAISLDNKETVELFLKYGAEVDPNNIKVMEYLVDNNLDYLVK